MSAYDRNGGRSASALLAARVLSRAMGRGCARG
jgi:hypothetical protein